MSSTALTAATAAALVLGALAAPSAHAQQLPEQIPFVGPNDGYPDQIVATAVAAVVDMAPQ